MSELDFSEFFDSCKGSTSEDMRNAVRTCRFVEAKASADAAEYQKRLVMQEFRPSHMYPVSMQHDGFRWVCRYVAEPQALLEDATAGVEAYGVSPEHAMQSFDRLWIGEIAEANDDDDDDDDDDDGTEDQTGEDI